MLREEKIHLKLKQHHLNKGIEMLHGLISGMLADGLLNNLEIKYLSTWLSEHADVASVWPGNVVAKLLSEILNDGIMTDAEQSQLLKMLTDLSGVNFEQTGSVTAEATTLPLDNICPIDTRDVYICLTGEFRFGTRPKCEELAISAGAIPHPALTKKIAYLIIGTNVSLNWAHTSYGRKIEQAVAHQQSGHPMKIISEQRWLASMQ